MLKALQPFLASTLSKLGNGTLISFWHDKWCSDRKLVDYFPALYEQSTRKMLPVDQCRQSAEGSWRWKLLFRRNLTGVLVNNFEHLMSWINSTDILDSSDKRFWRWTATGVFIISCFHQLWRGSLRLSKNVGL